MPVFISYRHMDRAHAININTRLIQANIKTYLDVLDAESQTTDDITGVITRNISECTHLLAVVSEKTALSWWVPFEIGEATITNRRICSFKTGPTELPLYLDKWPKLTQRKGHRVLHRCLSQRSDAQALDVTGIGDRQRVGAQRQQNLMPIAFTLTQVQNHPRFLISAHKVGPACWR